MKKKNSILIYPFVIMGVLIMLTTSCKKDEDEAVKKDPIITWANPADISIGTMLSATQLNATADVPGTFVYTPAIGTILNEGANQDLKVDFTPTDTETYNTATKTVKINVTDLTTVTDIDGNIYHTVVIGTQTWMLENLKVTHYRNGDAIPNVTDGAEWIGLLTGAYCDYDNTPDNSTTYGKLYNWYAVNDSRNLCPSGWHVPTDTEWTTLTDYLGGIDVAGGKMKETGTTHWNTPNTGATNESGFTALPGGGRNYYGTFDVIYDNGGWWSVTSDDLTHAWSRYVYYLDETVTRNNNTKTSGWSVRCIKDLVCQKAK
jgi:uncharacterized protein (TIGR02145 family)